jgi:transcriptional regulator of acetoin/glycerol metabolism
MERAVITSDNGKLNFVLNNNETINDNKPADDKYANKILTADELKNLEKENILRALQITNWRISGVDGAAALLEMPSTTLSSRIKSLDIRR